jgi:hypothetical protein
MCRRGVESIAMIRDPDALTALPRRLHDIVTLDIA